MLTLFELGGLNDCRYSLFSWRARYALAHKGLMPEYKPVRVSDKAAIAFSKQEKVPILIDGDDAIHDSFRIAQHLETKYPDKPLFGGEIGQSLSRFMNTWVDRTIEKAFGKTLEELSANREKDVAALRRLFDPVRGSLRSQPFICGSQPAYADYIVFSPLQWARIVAPVDILEPGDALAAWRERMLDLYAGLGRTTPARA